MPSSATVLSPSMAYEALNTLGHSGIPVVIVLNDNGAPCATVSIFRKASQLAIQPDLHADP